MERLMMMWALAEEAVAEAVAALEEHALAEETLVARFQFLV